MAQVVTDVRQHGVKVWDKHRCPGGPKGSDPLADLGHSRLALTLHGQRPPTQARSPGRPLWKALRGRERDSGFCLLVHGWHVAATLIDHSRPTPRPAPDYRDATARAPTSGPRGGGPGLAPGTPVTTGSQRHRLGSPHPDRGPCGTPAPGAGLACSGRCLPPGAGGQQAMLQGRATSAQGHSGRRPRARGRGPLRQAQQGVPELARPL